MIVPQCPLSITNSDLPERDSPRGVRCRCAGSAKLSAHTITSGSSFSSRAETHRIHYVVVMAAFAGGTLHCRRRCGVASRAVGGDLGRRHAAALLGGTFGACSLPKVVVAGPFISFLSDVLPVKEAQKATAQFDLWLRDSYSTVLDRTVPVPYRPPEVANASGAEGTVFTAGDLAAAETGANIERIRSRFAALEQQEGRRLRGRAAAGLFESELLGEVTIHLAGMGDSYPFRAYCRWRSYAEVLGATRANDGENQGVAAARFNAKFGYYLLSSALTKPPAAPMEVTRKCIGSFVAEFRTLLACIVNASLVSIANLDADDVLVDLWAAGESKELAITAVLEGDPLTDAQVLLSEEFGASVSPNPAVACIEAWLSTLLVGKAGDVQDSSRVQVSVDRYYVTSRYRNKTERMAMAYVPRQQFLQVTLR